MSYVEQKDRTLVIGASIVLFLLNFSFVWFVVELGKALSAEKPTVLYFVVSGYMLLVVGLLFVGCKRVDDRWAYSSFVTAGLLPFASIALVLTS